MLRSGLLPLVLLAAASGAAPAVAQSPERWQLTLGTSDILYELQPLGLAGDTLVLRQGGSERRLPLREITELRRVRKSMRLMVGGERRRSLGDLVGADDQVFQMRLMEVPEKRELVRRILAAYGPGRPRQEPGSRDS